MAEIGIAGAGFSGAVIGRELAEAGHRVTVFDTRDHIAGNCHTERDEASDVMVHVYGPHIFHTQWDHVWEYINRFGVDAAVQPPGQGDVGRPGVLAAGQPAHDQPVLRHDDGPGRGPGVRRRQGRAAASGEIVSFEDQGLAFVGREIYEAFLAGYTRKQWGTEPADLPASILQRLPLRFNYDDSYFNHPYQAIPEDGYTPIVAAILDHPAIEVRLSTALGRDAGFDHVVWTGPIDAYFEHEHGRLGYRTLDFEREVHDGDFQGCPVMNYCDPDVPFTRITEFKHFTPWESHDRTVTYREFSRAARAGRHRVLPDPPRAGEGPAARVRRAGPGGARRDVRRPPRHVPLPGHGRDDQGGARRRRRDPRRPGVGERDPGVRRRSAGVTKPCRATPAALCLTGAHQRKEVVQHMSECSYGTLEVVGR